MNRPRGYQGFSGGYLLLDPGLGMPGFRGSGLKTLRFLIGPTIMNAMKTTNFNNQALIDSVYLHTTYKP